MGFALLQKPKLPPHTKHFVELPNRRVSYRTLGTGPVLVLIHMSPLDSSHVLVLADQLRHQFTCLMPDTPGYGESDPLSIKEPTIDDYAAGLHDLLLALSISSCFVYGSHTGAKIALVLGAKNPELVAGVVLDGLRITSPEQREQRKSNYAPLIVPVPDGSHLLTTWERVLKTSSAWFVPNPSFPKLPQLVNLMRSELAAKPWYGQAYSAAFAFDPLPTLESFKGEVLFIARNVDQLSLACKEKLPSRPNIKSITSIDDGTEALIATDVAEFFSDVCAKIPINMIENRPSATRWVETQFGTSRVNKKDQQSIHLDLLSTVNLLDSETASTVSIQLPGFGDSIWKQEFPATRKNLIAHILEVAQCCNLKLTEDEAFEVVASSRLSALSQLLEDVQMIEPDLAGEYLVKFWQAVNQNELLERPTNEGEATQLIVDLLSTTQECLAVSELI